MKYLLLSLITFFVAAPIGLEAWNLSTGKASISLSILSVLISMLSIVMAWKSYRIEKTTVGSGLLIFLNLISLYVTITRYSDILIKF